MVSIAAPKPHMDIVLPFLHSSEHFGILEIKLTMVASLSLMYSTILERSSGLSLYPGPKMVIYICHNLFCYYIFIEKKFFLVSRIHFKCASKT